MRKPRVPRPLNYDTLGYVKAGLSRINKQEDVVRTIRTKAHMALRALELGEAGLDDIHTLENALQMALSLAKQGLQTAWSGELVAASESVRECRTAKELDWKNLQTIQLGLAVHDKQLDTATVIQIERGLPKRSGYHGKYGSCTNNQPNGVDQNEH